MHCGSAAGKAREDELTTEEALNLCNDLKRIDCKGVALMGGEPLLRRDWPLLAEEVHNLDMELSIITNGWIACDSKVTRHMKDLSPECIAVSLDGGQASVHDKIRGVPGSFDRALSAIEHFAGLGLPTSVITTVHKLNLRELKKIRSLLVGKGIAWQIQMATPYGRLTREYVLSKEEYYSVAMFIIATRKLYSKKKLLIAGAHDMGYYSNILPEPQVLPWQGCQAGISTLGIQSNGNILGCLALPDSFIEGNIRETALSDIWYDSDSFSYSRHVRQSDLGGACASCEFRKYCKGGCSAVSYSMGGGLHRDPYCLRAIEKNLEL
jgi:radical SAM protein with 4Fe4S-binding SPASM domain